METSRPLSSYSDAELQEHFKVGQVEGDWTVRDFLEIERRGLSFLESDPQLLKAVSIENERLNSNLREAIKPFLVNMEKDSAKLKSLVDKFTPTFDVNLLQSQINVSEVFKPISDEVLKSVSNALALKESSLLITQNSALQRFQRNMLEVSALSSQMFSLGKTFAQKSIETPLSLIPSTPLDTPIQYLLKDSNLAYPIGKEVESEERKLALAALQNISSSLSQSESSSIEANKLLESVLAAVRTGSTPKWMIIVATASSVAAALEGFFIFFMS